MHYVQEYETPIILRRLQTQRDTDTANAARRDAALLAELLHDMCGVPTERR